jgi:hypothetical protein
VTITIAQEGRYTGDFMHAFLKRKELWEQENREQILRLVKASQNVSSNGIKFMMVAGNVVLFALFVGVRAVSLLFLGPDHGPKLRRRVGPMHRPQERHEFENNVYECKARFVMGR